MRRKGSRHTTETTRSSMEKAQLFTCIPNGVPSTPRTATTPMKIRLQGQSGSRQSTTARTQLRLHAILLVKLCGELLKPSCALW